MTRAASATTTNHKSQATSQSQHKTKSQATGVKVCSLVEEVPPRDVQNEGPHSSCGARRGCNLQTVPAQAQVARPICLTPPQSVRSRRHARQQRSAAPVLQASYCSRALDHRRCSGSPRPSCNLESKHSVRTYSTIYILRVHDTQR